MRASRTFPVLAGWPSPADLPYSYRLHFFWPDSINELICNCQSQKKDHSTGDQNAGKPADLPRTLLDVDPDPDHLVIRTVQGVHACGQQELN